MSTLSVVSNPIQLSVVDNSIELSIVPNTVEILFNTGVVTNVGLDSHYVHTQSAPATTWTINHYLNKYPCAIAIDSAGDYIIPNVTYISTNQLLLTYINATSGVAYLN